MITGYYDGAHRKSSDKAASAYWIDWRSRRYQGKLLTGKQTNNSAEANGLLMLLDHFISATTTPETIPPHLFCPAREADSDDDDAGSAAVSMLHATTTAATGGTAAAVYPTVTTNNGNNIDWTTTHIHVHCVGDSDYCTNYATTLTPDTTDDDIKQWASNPAVWCQISKALRKLRTRCTVTFEWRARHYNAPADEVCNATLDDRQCSPVELVLPASSPLHLDDDLPNQIYAKACSHRIHAWRSLPAALHRTWRLLIDQLTVSAQQHSTLEAIVHVAPAIFLSKVLFPTFTDLKDGLNLICSSESFRNSTINTFLTQSSTPPVRAAPAQPDRQDTVKRAQRLTGLGAERKAMQLLARTESVTSPSPDVMVELKRLYPARKHPLRRDPHAPSSTNVTEAKVCRIIRYKTPRATAPGFDGWTRELLIPLTDGPHSITRLFLRDWMASLVNGTASAEYNTFLRTGILIAIRKTNGKHRPVIVMSAVKRCAWRVAFDVVALPRVLHGAQRAGKYTCQRAISVANAALRNKNTVICIDASNAFGEIKRHTIHEKLKSTPELRPILHLFEEQYCDPFIARATDANGHTHDLQVHEGVIQGCAGSMQLFEIGLSVALNALPNHVKTDNTAAVADDIAIWDNRASTLFTRFAKIKDELTKHGITINPEKSCIVGQDSKEASKLCKIPEKAHVDYLGGRLFSPNNTSQLSSDDIRSKYTARMEALSSFIPPRTATSDGPVPATDSSPDAPFSYLSCQTAFILTRYITFCARYLFMNTDPKWCTAIAEKFTTWQRDTLDRLCGCKLSDKQFARCCIPAKDGGLDIINWHETRKEYHAAMRNILYNETPFNDSLKAIETKQADRYWQQFESDAPNPSLQRRIFQEARFPWFTIRPESQALCVSDAEWRVNIRLRLNINITEIPKCSTYPTHNSINDHALACNHCVGATWRSRHNRILRALCRVLYDHGIHASIAAIANALGTRRDIGPDALVYADRIYAIDTTCTHQATVVHNYAPSHARYRKNIKYDALQSKTKWITTPIVMTSMGHPDSATTKWLNLIGKSSFSYGLATRAMIAMSIAVIRGNHDIVSYLQTRQLDLGNFQSGE